MLGYFQDLDQDNEWLSEDEEFEREQQEAQRLRAAAQRRAIADTESLSDEDQSPEHYESRQGTELDRGQAGEYSDEEIGFQGRNAPLRKSMSRNSYSAEDYSSGEELAMNSAPPRQEPGQDEMGEHDFRLGQLDIIISILYI